MGMGCAAMDMCGLESEKDLFELVSTDIVLCLFHVAIGLGHLPEGMTDGDVARSLAKLGGSDNGKIMMLAEVLRSLLKGGCSPVSIRAIVFIIETVGKQAKGMLLANLSESERESLARIMRDY